MCRLWNPVKFLISLNYLCNYCLLRSCCIQFLTRIISICLLFSLFSNWYLNLFLVFGGRIPKPAGGAGASLRTLSRVRPGFWKKPNSQQVMSVCCKESQCNSFSFNFRDAEGYNRSKSRYGSESIISGSSSIDRRSLGKSIDRKSSDSDYSGSGSRKSSSDRKLSASRHSLLSRGSDL